MKSRMMAALIGSTLMMTAPVLTHGASAQPVPPSSSGSYVVPVVVGAAAGATVGALLWPVVVPTAVAPAAATAMAAAPAAAGWGWGAFMTTRALVGAVIGGALGYISAR